MKKLLLGLLLVMPLSISAEGKYKFLHYRFNENVVITISNAPCTDKQIIKEYPYAVVASRVDDKFLQGCFKNRDNTNIEIQWLHGGDKSILPANVFLQKDEV